MIQASSARLGVRCLVHAMGEAIGCADYATVGVFLATPVQRT